jgi:predicted nicotinamide N-methyase
LLQLGEAAELPDDGPVEWAPVAPYWSVLWRSGVALARAVPRKAASRSVRNSFTAIGSSSS